MPSRVFRFWEANQIIPAIIGFIPVYVGVIFPFKHFSLVLDITENVCRAEMKNGSAFPVVLHQSGSGRINAPHGGTKPCICSVRA